MMPSNRIVLAIEDNALNRMSLKTVFQMDNIRMLEAKDVESGIRMLHRHKPDLILIDHDLGGTDISSAVQLIKNDSAFQKIPILAFTGGNKSTNGNNVLQSGISALISKPILSRSFLEDVKKYMNHQKKADESSPLMPEIMPAAAPVETPAEMPDVKLEENVQAQPPAEAHPQDPYIFDWLTGLFNQGYIRKSMDLEIKRALRHGYSVSLIKLDVDDFRKHNDGFGRWLGDLVLREAGEIVRSSIREIDLAGRYANDEFVIVLPYADKEGALHVAQRILNTVHSHIFSPGVSILVNAISICMGIVTCPSDVKTLEDALSEAERRLQKARAKGQNQLYGQD